MTEAEILPIRNDLTGLVVSAVSVSFGMISAYIAGLWLFLRRSAARAPAAGLHTVHIWTDVQGHFDLGLERTADGNGSRLGQAQQPCQRHCGIWRRAAKLVLRFDLVRRIGPSRNSGIRRNSFFAGLSDVHLSVAEYDGRPGSRHAGLADKPNHMVHLNCRTIPNSNCSLSIGLRRSRRPRACSM
jgi:hypothetical protein